MKTLLCLAIGALLLSQSLAEVAGAQERKPKNEESLDAVTHLPATQQRAAVDAVMDDASIAAVTPAQVGDADSFARKVKYLGLVMTGSVVLQADCTNFDTSFGDRCFPFQQDTTSFGAADLGRIDLPAKASHSLLCFDLTPVSQLQFDNPTPAPRLGRLTVSAGVVVENPVLNDPTLIDPVTGLPFGGRLQLWLSFPMETRTIAPGAVDFRTGIGPTRSCIGGLLRKQSLMDRGLTEKQATQFFKKPTTLRFGLAGSVSSVSSFFFSYGMRVYGD